jgi:hypothetical protein
MMMKYCPKLKVMLKSDEIFSQIFFWKFLANSFPKKKYNKMRFFVAIHECVIGVVTILKQN